jgi:hypothetical protein
MNTWYVYSHIRLDKNSPFYIGIGNQKAYKRAFMKKGRNKIWKSIVEKTKYEVQILIDNLTKEEADIKEKYYISVYKKIKDGGILCNLTDGGDGCSGYKHDKIALEKISKSSKGNATRFQKGVKTTKEIIEKIKSANLGKKRTQETKQKISLAHLGKVFSEETIEKMRLAKLGKKQPDSQKEKRMLSKDKIYSEEVNKKRSEALRGVKKSAESIEKRKLTILNKKNNLCLVNLC